jgi:hypothetical protein
MLDKRMKEYWTTVIQNIKQKLGRILNLKIAECWIERRQNIGAKYGRILDSLISVSLLKSVYFFTGQRIF